MGSSDGVRTRLVDAVLTRRRLTPSTGVPMTWGTALERFARAVHRYHDRVEVVGDRALREQLRGPGALLEESLAATRGVRGHGAESAQAVRDVLRAGTLCSHAIEAAVAATAARRAGDDAETEQAVATAQALARVVADLVGEVVTGCAPAPKTPRRLFPS